MTFACRRLEISPGHMCAATINFRNNAIHTFIAQQMYEEIDDTSKETQFIGQE